MSDSDMFEKIRAAADRIREKCGDSEIGLILGSGLADTIKLDNGIFMDYSEIPFFPVSTVADHMSEWVSGTLGGKKVCMMRGRFHLYEGYSGEELAMPVRVMKMLGVKKLIVTNASGGVNTCFEPGDLMIIRDHINYSGVNPLVGLNDKRIGPRFPDMSYAYDKELSRLAHECAFEEGITLRDGVYMQFSGPSYETPAEIRMARILGADAVGMSTVPEVIAARHCGIDVLGISCVTNMAAGVTDKPLDHREVVETGKKVRDKLARIITAVIGKINLD